MTTPSHDDETQELQSVELAHVTGETPVVRSIDDVPFEVLEELTEAFEGISIVDEDGPEYFEGHVLGGYDIVSDDDLTHARRPPLVIEDKEFTQPLERSDDGQPHRRFRLRKNIFINTTLCSDEVNVFGVDPLIFQHFSNRDRRKYMTTGATSTNNYPQRPRRSHAIVTSCGVRR